MFRHGQSVSFNERSLSVLLKKNRCFCHKQIQIRCRVSTESILISVWNQTAHQNWWKHNLICTKATNKHICQMEFKCETASAWEWMAICRIWLKLLTRYCFFSWFFRSNRIKYCWLRRLWIQNRATRHHGWPCVKWPNGKKGDINLNKMSKTLEPFNLFCKRRSENAMHK